MCPEDFYEKSPVIKAAVDFIVSDQALAVGHKENLERLYNELLNKDWFMTLLDLEDYIATKDRYVCRLRGSGKVETHDAGKYRQSRILLFRSVPSQNTTAIFGN